LRRPYVCIRIVLEDWKNTHGRLDGELLDPKSVSPNDIDIVSVSVSASQSASQPARPTHTVNKGR
jgi:hypothetical protein